MGIRRGKRWPLLVILLLFLNNGGCASFQQDSSAESTADLATKEKIRTLQEKLKSLQEQLVILEAQKSLEKAARPEAPPAWDPLALKGEEKPGYGMYTYLLCRAASGEEGEKHLAVLMEGITALPGRSDLSEAETNRFLVPLLDPKAKPAPVNYSAILAAQYLDFLGDPAAGLKGPLLVSSYRPLGAKIDDALLVLNLAGCKPDFILGILPAFLPAVETEATRPFSDLFWRIIDQKAPTALTVSETGRSLVLGCPQ